MAKDKRDKIAELKRRLRTRGTRVEVPELGLVGPDALHACDLPARTMVAFLKSVEPLQKRMAAAKAAKAEADGELPTIGVDEISHQDQLDLVAAYRPVVADGLADADGDKIFAGYEGAELLDDLSFQAIGRLAEAVLAHNGATKTSDATEDAEKNSPTP